MGNGMPVSMAHTGSSNFTTASTIFHLNSVLHVPRICKNLLSVANFSNDNQAYFEFHPLHCFVKDIKTESILLTGRMHNGLYQFDLSDSKQLGASLSLATAHAVHLAIPRDSIFDLWHKRLGHPYNKTVMQVLCKKNIVSTNCKLPSLCSACQLGKFHKLPFSLSTTKYLIPFELIVVDLWGPACEFSEGFSYYISFVDTYIHYTWLYLLRHKSEALEKFLHLQKFVTVQFGCSIKVLQSDWGGEFRSFPKALAQLGIHHQFSCPHTFEQNDLVERKHRHIVDVGLTLLAQASVPMRFWTHAFVTAVYLINKLLTTVLNGKSPYELLHHSSPDYIPIHKGYKCLDDTGKLIVSQHVMFDEIYFLFAATTTSPGGHVSLTSSSLFLHQQSRVPIMSGSVPSLTSVSVDCTGLQTRPATDNMTIDTARSNGSPTMASLVVFQAVSSSILVSKPLPAPPVNTHPMWTRSKSGIFKPRVFSAELGASELSTIEEALSCKEWALVAQQEFDALLRNQTWDLVPLPANKKAKAGVDFHETFSPIVKPTTIRVVLTLAVKLSWLLRQLDVNNVFLNGDLSEEIYMVQPPGFEQQHGDRPLDACLYVLVYIDDLIVTGNHQCNINKFVKTLDAKFSLKDLGPLSYFIGIEVLLTTERLFLSQQKYVFDLLKKANMDQAKGSPTLMVTSTILSRHVGSAVENESEYRSIVGALQYVVITRPDIAFAVNRLCQFMHKPLDQYFKAVKRILRYLHNTMDYGLHFAKADCLDLGTDMDDRRSITRFCVFLGGNPVAWGSKKQQVVSRSTAKAEYRGLTYTISEVVWLESLLSELHVLPSRKAEVWCDNSGAVAVLANLVLHSKFKHVELDLFFVREKIAAGKLTVRHVPALEQVADEFTKPLSTPFFTKFRSCLKVIVKHDQIVEVRSWGHNKDQNSCDRLVAVSSS
ncbi:hypothetical protein CXB51_028231 [Gossypium anomalum]|uniref:Integrase catalytic domain-containing protein n=1 Tax=Gossypium anomalum TaxID=47600 RepID=A0A8J5YYE8_9ROSI|nr:hypothetical protein CXB51_028231 [Gossypium anomalum]